MGKKKVKKLKAVKKAKTHVLMKAFLACEAISQDPSSRKNSLYGLFDLIQVESFPSVFKPFNVYVVLSNISGKHRFFLSGSGPGTASVGHQEDEMEINANATGDTAIAVGVGGLPMLGEGQVNFIAYIDGEPIGWPCVIHIRKLGKQ